MADFHLQIISPTRVEFEGDIESLIVPGEDGYLGILADHAPLLSTLREGDLTIRKGEDKQVMKVLKGGFVEVHHNHVVVLVGGLEGTAGVLAAKESTPE